MAGVDDDGDKTSEGSLRWSNGIDLSYEQDVFVTIPRICDVKVHIEKVGHTSHVFIDPVGRAEVSAREIRSRIKGKETVKLIEEKKSSSPPRDLRLPMVSRNTVGSSLMFEGSAIFKEFSVSMLDQITKPDILQEVLRFTVTDFVLSLVPNIEGSMDQMKNYQPHVKYNLLCALSDAQLDNQLYQTGGYDFQVLFIKESYKLKKLNIKYSQFDSAELHSILNQQSMFVVNANVCQDLLKFQVTLESVEIQLKPVMVFLEDTYLYEVLKRVDKCLPISLSNVPLVETNLQLPLEVTQTATAISQPIRLQKLTIQPISMQFSLHASLKVFVALDNAPLSFGIFQRNFLFTTPATFLHNVLMHYVAAALIRAGNCITVFLYLPE